MYILFPDIFHEGEHHTQEKKGIVPDKATDQFPPLLPGNGNENGILFFLEKNIDQKTAATANGN